VAALVSTSLQYAFLGCALTVGAVSAIRIVRDKPTPLDTLRRDYKNRSGWGLVAFDLFSMVYGPLLILAVVALLAFGVLYGIAAAIVALT